MEGSRRPGWVVSLSLSWAVQQSYHGEPSTYVGARDDCMLGRQDWLELVAVLWERWCLVVSSGGFLFVLFEDGLEGGSCMSRGVVAG